MLSKPPWKNGQNLAGISDLFLNHQQTTLERSETGFKQLSSSSLQRQGRLYTKLFFPDTATLFFIHSFSLCNTRDFKHCYKSVVTARLPSN